MMSDTGSSTFPDDIFLRVATYLEVDDILILRKACRYLCTSTKLKHLWLEVLERDVESHETLMKRCKPVADLSSSQLERLALYTHAIHKHTALGELPKSHIKLDRPRSVTWVHLLAGQWLLAASSDSSVSELTLWSLHSDGQAKHEPVANAYLDGPVADGRVDVGNARVVLALEIRSPDQYADVLTLSIKDRDGAPAFVRLAHLPGVSRIRALSGSRLGFALYSELSIPCVIDWTTKQVARLRDTPDVTGGCVAMAIQGHMVAVVMPKCLEVYIRSKPETLGFSQYRRLCAIALPMTFPDATVMFSELSTPSQGHRNDNVRPLCIIRLCLASEGQVHVYDAVVRPNGETILHNTWSYPPKRRGDKTQPCFGQSVRTLTWFDAPGYLPWRHVAFAAATVPVMDPSQPSTTETEASHPVTVYTFSSLDAPALHCMGVRDYDEDLGIFVLGNACGELCVYNLIGQYSSDLTSCLRDIPISIAPIDEPDWLPTEPIPSCAAAPYPYSGPGTFAEPTPAMYEAIYARCAAARPEDVPENWTTDGFSYDEAQWPDYIPVVGENIAWELERTKNFLGNPVPLLFHQRQLITIFQSGGLLFIYFDQSTAIWVLRYGISATDAARAYNEGQINELCVAMVADEPMCCPESYRYFVLWDWEKFAFARNRWRELKDRGGEVEPMWLNDKAVLGKKCLQWEEPHEGET